MTKKAAAAWPYCETTEVLELRARRRTLLVEIALAVFLVGSPIAAWQGIVLMGTLAAGTA